MSIVRVVNKALALIGNEMIVDLNEDSENAIYANALAWDSVDYVLAQHDWSDARVRRRLTPDAKGPDFGYKNRFLLPSDPRCLVVWQEDNDAKYVREGNYLLADENYLNIIYTGAIRDLTFASPELIECCAAKLALDMAPKIRMSAAMLQWLNQHYEDVLNKARHTDSANNSTTLYSTSNVWVYNNG